MSDGTALGSPGLGGRPKVKASPEWDSPLELEGAPAGSPADVGEPQGAAGQNQARALAVSRADRAEDVSRLGSLIFRRCGAGAAFGPAPRDLVLLPDPGLIGKPDLERLAAGLGLCDLLQTGGEVFLKAATAASFLA